jgi:hypothetical protein
MSSNRTRFSERITRAALLAAAIASSMAAAAEDQDDFTRGSGTIVLNNPGDPNFNQLLGINDGGAIVG